MKNIFLMPLQEWVVEFSQNLLMIIFVTIGGFKALTSFPTKVTSVIVYFLFALVFFPIMYCTAMLTIHQIKATEAQIGNRLTTGQKCGILFRTLSMSVINPIGKDFLYLVTYLRFFCLQLLLSMNLRNSMKSYERTYLIHRKQMMR